MNKTKEYYALRAKQVTNLNIIEYFKKKYGLLIKFLGRT